MMYDGEVTDSVWMYSLMRETEDILPAFDKVLIIIGNGEGLYDNRVRDAIVKNDNMGVCGDDIRDTGDAGHPRPCFGLVIDESRYKLRDAECRSSYTSARQNLGYW